MKVYYDITYCSFFDFDEKGEGGAGDSEGGESGAGEDSADESYRFAQTNTREEEEYQTYSDEGSALVCYAFTYYSFFNFDEKGEGGAGEGEEEEGKVEEGKDGEDEKNYQPPIQYRRTNFNQHNEKIIGDTSRLPSHMCLFEDEYDDDDDDDTTTEVNYDVETGYLKQTTVHKNGQSHFRWL